MERAIFIPTQRGGRSLVRQNYKFYFHKELQNNLTQFRCKNYQRRCPSIVKINNDEMIVETSPHRANCMANSNTLIALEFRNDLKIRGRANRGDDPCKVLADSLIALGPRAVEVNVSEPTKLASKKMIYRARKDLGNLEKDPDHRMQIPNSFFQKYENNSRGDRFLLHDDGYGREDRMVIFGSERNLKKIFARSRFWLADGTFDAVPKLFAQLYTVHVMDGGEFIPVVYALLPNKSAETYQRLFAVLKNLLGADLSPEYFITDYESAIIPAILAAFPNTIHLGCYFHFKQALIRNINSKGLNLLFADEVFARQFKRIAALAFLPTLEDLELGWSWVCDNTGEELEPFLAYFEENWMGYRARDGTRKPRFQHKMWNFYDQIIESIPLTINGVEGWHTKLDCLMDRHSKSLSNLLDAIIRDSAGYDADIDKILTGHTFPTRTDTHNRTFTERVTNLVASFPQQISVQDYINNVSSIMLRVR